MLITELNKKAFDVLNNTFGYSSYRYEQEKIINSVLSGNHTLAIMPTGAGKSLCYKILLLTSYPSNQLNFNKKFIINSH